MNKTPTDEFTGAVVDSLPSRVITMKEEEFEKTSKALADAGFRNISRLEAVNGKAMKSTISGDRTVITYRAEYEIDHAEYREAHSSMPSWGGVGCYLSHVKAWEEAMKTPHGLFVFEADAIPAGPDAYEETKKVLLQFVAAHSGKPPDLLFIGGNGYPKTEDVQGVPSVKRLLSRMFGTEGYYVSPEGAQKLRKEAYPIEVQVDTFISYVMRVDNGPERFKAYVLTKKTMGQENQEGTSIQLKEVRDDGGYEDPMMRMIRYGMIGLAVVLFILALLEARRISR